MLKNLLTPSCEIYFMITVFVFDHSGLKDGDMGMNSPMSWFRGGIGDQGIQSLNFQGHSISPWMQPRLDPSMLCLQPDSYQVMAAAAMQDMGLLDPSKMTNQSLLQFQQNIPNASASLLQNQMMQQPHSQPSFLQNLSGNNAVSQAQILHQQLQGRQSFINQQFQDQQMKKSIPTSLQMGPASESTSQLQNFSDLIGNHMASSNNSSMQSILSSFSREGASPLMNLNGPHPHPLVSHSSSKRVALDPQLPSKVSQFGVPHPEELVMPNSKVSDLSALLPPFHGKEFSDFNSVAHSHSHDDMLFGVSSDSSANMLIRNGGNENESLSMPYATPTFPSGGGTEFPLNSDMTTSSCVDESGYMQSSENVDQTNSTPGAFVKVNKHETFQVSYCFI